MGRFLCRALCVVVFACVYSFPVRANDAWPSDAINRTIEQTNFIVGQGCSGTLISASKGLILTNYHCIDRQVSSVDREITNAEGWVRKVKIRKYDDVTVGQKHYNGFTQVGQSQFIAEIVAEAQTRDLAVLKVKGKIPNTYASPFAPETHNVMRGQRVYIVGNPLGEDASLVVGYVSSVNRAFDFPWTAGARLPVIQISGGLAGGNSGGALYNDVGQLIGVPAAGYNSANHIGFAIPMQVIKPFLLENCLASVFDTAADDDKCKADKLEKAKKAKEEK
jgi:S1-C subfamily serine protease